MKNSDARAFDAFLSAVALAGAAAASAVACDKVPLREHAARFEVAAAHWYENEKTQYVFFQVKGLRPGQATLAGGGRFDVALDGGGWKPVPFEASLHEHRLVKCGDDALCGSFSYRAERAAADVRLRYVYDARSEHGVESQAANEIHGEGNGAFSQSALVYGVFDSDNRRVQARVHDNFGVPDSARVADYGLVRRYAVEDLRLADVGEAQQRSLAAETQTSFLFPASVCALTPRGSARRMTFSGREGWAPDALDPLSTLPTACFLAKLLARDGSTVREAHALARRNPVLQGSSLAIRSPLRPARKVPLVLTYCPEGAGGAGQSFAPFLEYQRYILGIGPAPVDACFSVENEERFQADLARILTNKIAAARASAGPERQDFVLAVVVHHRLAPIVGRFHQLIAEAIGRKIADEQALASPRLAGAFVYDSQPLQARPIRPGPGVVWCPRVQPENAGAGPGYGPNCTPASGGRYQLGPFNFLVPMGPFPTMDAFRDYRAAHGEEGRVGNPRFDFQAVQTNEASQSDGSTATFLDGQAIAAAPGEGVRFCRERDSEGQLYGLAFRRQGATTPSEPVAMGFEAAQELLANPSERTVLNVGLRWEHPFVGAVRYDLPVEGRVFGVIPVTVNRRSMQEFGDAKWTRTRWDVGPLLQKCLRHCGHPYFDESGEYRIAQTWREARECPQPRYPSPLSEASP